MKICGWAFTFLGWLLLVAAGSAALCLGLDRAAALGRAGEWLQLVGGFHWITYYGVGAGLLLLALAALLGPISGHARQRLLEFPTESGKVQVDITALETCLARVVSEEDGVIRARVSLRGGTGGGATPLGCNATVWFEAGPDVIGRVSGISARMRAYYYQVLPIKEPVKIYIRTKLVYRKRTAEAIEESAKADRVTPQRESTRTVAEGEDYSGPQYPSVGSGETGEEDVKV
jgi:hypothetical protein